MRSPTTSLRAVPLLTLCATLMAALQAGAVGLENGEVTANAEQSLGGITSNPDEELHLSAIAPDPDADPPLPPTFAPARAKLDGSMRSLELETTAGLTAQFGHISSTSNALVEFVDNLVVNAEGIAPGTDLIVEVAWTTGGTVEFTGPERIKNRSKIQLLADGVDLDPDPGAPEPPKQIWTRDISNFFPVDLEDFGAVAFEFLVQAGTPNPGNIRMRSAAGVVCGAPGSIRTGQYDSDALANLTVDFLGATNVKTVDGIELYRWTTAAQSSLDYGSRDDDPPSNPELTVSPSEGGADLVNLSWETVLGEFYIVESNSGVGEWTPITEVLGTDSTVSIDLFMDDPETAYRLISNFGSGTPDPPLVTPALRVTKQDAMVRVAWQTNHWENYQLDEINPDGSSSQLEQVSGNGGESWFKFTPQDPGQLFQVEATLK